MEKFNEGYLWLSREPTSKHRCRFLAFLFCQKLCIQWVQPRRRWPRARTLIWLSAASWRTTFRHHPGHCIYEKLQKSCLKPLLKWNNHLFIHFLETTVRGELEGPLKSKILSVHYLHESHIYIFDFIWSVYPKRGLLDLICRPRPLLYDEASQVWISLCLKGFVSFILPACTYP